MIKNFYKFISEDLEPNWFSPETINPNQRGDLQWINDSLYIEESHLLKGGQCDWQLIQKVKDLANSGVELPIFFDTDSGKSGAIMGTADDMFWTIIKDNNSKNIKKSDLKTKDVEELFAMNPNFEVDCIKAIYGFSILVLNVSYQDLIYAKKYWQEIPNKLPENLELTKISTEKISVDKWKFDIEIRKKKV
jgi:hypothetical protein